MTRIVPRTTVAVSRKRRVGRAYSKDDLAVIAKALHLRAEGMTITTAEIAQAMGRSASGLKSKLSRLKEVKPYRRVGPGLPGRRRREDRAIPADDDMGRAA